MGRGKNAARAQQQQQQAIRRPPPGAAMCAQPTEGGERVMRLLPGAACCAPGAPGSGHQGGESCHVMPGMPRRRFNFGGGGPGGPGPMGPGGARMGMPGRRRFNFGGGAPDDVIPPELYGDQIESGNDDADDDDDDGDGDEDGDDDGEHSEGAFDPGFYGGEYNVEYDDAGGYYASSDDERQFLRGEIERSFAGMTFGEVEEELLRSLAGIDSDGDDDPVPASLFGQNELPVDGSGAFGAASSSSANPPSPSPFGAGHEAPVPDMFGAAPFNAAAPSPFGAGQPAADEERVPASNGARPDTDAADSAPGGGGGAEGGGHGPLSSGLVPTGFYKGCDRAAALLSLNTAFQRDLARFIAAAAPDPVDCSSCMQQYMDLVAEIRS